MNIKTMDLASGGVINVLKPPGMTSFDVVGYLRRIFRVKRIGHTGTLDPAAVGVLPICIGKSTKAIEYLTEKDKLYRAEMTLGISTDTQDAEGQVLKTCEVDASEEMIRKVIQTFKGKLLQIPPMYSAVKIDGKKLYELAREGITVERKPRSIEVYSIDVISVKGNRVIMDVMCSKGTYIRTLCSDIGDAVGCGGHMSFLIRLKSGSFDIKNSYTIEQIEEASQNGRLADLLTGVDSVFENLKEIKLSRNDTDKILNGVFVEPEGLDKVDGQLYRIYNNAGSFIAIGETILRNGNVLLKTKKVF